MSSAIRLVNQLSQQQDVFLSALSNKHVLSYNSSTKKWENTALNHSDLTGVQGGDSTGVYHLTNDQYAALLNIINVVSSRGNQDEVYDIITMMFMP